jgi:hypothetical protein
VSSRALGAIAAVALCGLAFAHLPTRSFEDPHAWRR